MAFPGVFAWSPVSSSAVTTAIGVDPGAWNAWRNRRLTPSPLPAEWFKPAPGRPRYYMVSEVQTWIAARRGERFVPLDAWRISLANEAADDDDVRRHAQALARALGPRFGEATFTPAGFQAYLASLLS